MMEPERWQQVERIYYGALERGADERVAFLSEVCGADEELRREVESLLACDATLGQFIEAPALQVAANLLARRQGALKGGTRLSHYQIISQLGAGGMGEVYLAQDTKLGRQIALKLLPVEFTQDAVRLLRFKQEARAASALNHPNIITVYEIGEANGTRYIATEFIEGETLRQRLKPGRLELREALEVAIQVAGALQAAHTAGVVHRDIKPENVMLRPDGLVKVLDFGLAKLTEVRAASVETEAPLADEVKTETGVVMGTVRYMSPEQARGLKVDARTDIFSLGVLLYEMLAGQAPFAGATTADLIAAILERQPQPLQRYAPAAPRELERIVSKMLRKDREERYQTSKELLVDLKEINQQLEFAAKLERAKEPDGQPAARAGSLVALGTGRAPVELAPVEAVATSEAATAPRTASTKILLGEIKRHKLSGALALAAVLIVAAAAFFYFNRAPALTDKDTILLADFINLTSDAVFDSTLKQGLAVQLQQSPFLNIFPDERVREMLPLMGHSPEAPVTHTLARQLCQRLGLKAMLTGSIASLGRHYVITLEAINSQTSERLTREQVEAENKEQVLPALARAATQLRKKLGESLHSIQKFDAPIDQVTTSSLEALKAWSLGIEQSIKGKPLEGIPFFKRAIDLDPKFALAYLSLSYAYGNTQQGGLAAEFAERAFALRARVSEREKLWISSRYYDVVTEELDKTNEALELWKQTYPRDYWPRNNLSYNYLELGQFDKALDEARAAIRLNPYAYYAYQSLASAFMRLNRFEEASAVFEQARRHQLDWMGLHRDAYSIAFVAGDTKVMRQQVEWATGKSNEYEMLNLQAAATAFAGQWRQSKGFSSRAIDSVERRQMKEVAAAYTSAVALMGAVFGDCQQTHKDAIQALAISRSKTPLKHGALALALCGEVKQSQSLADELVKQYPRDTLINGLWLPLIRAALTLQRGNAAQAIEQLQPASRYEPAAEFWPQYLRGQAYLKLGQSAEALAEFQKILDHRGQAPLSALYPLAHLGLARAAALTGSIAQSRKAYQDFLALWQNADTDLPVLLAAKQEYERLK